MLKGIKYNEYVFYLLLFTDNTDNIRQWYDESTILFTREITLPVHHTIMSSHCNRIQDKKNCSQIPKL